MGAVSAGNLRGLPGQTQFLGSLLLAVCLLSLVAYLAAIAQPNQGYVPIWPEGGIGLALVWRHGARYWPAIFASNTVLSASVGTPLFTAFGVGWLQVLIALTALSLLQRWKIHPQLADMKQLGGFVLALLGASSLALPIYAFRMWFLFQYPPLRALAFGADYFLTAMFGFLIFTPVIVSWRAKALAQKLKRRLFIVSMSVLALAGWGLLSLPEEFRDRMLFLLLPFVVICAIIGRAAGASAAAALLTMTMVAMGSHDAVPILDNILRALFILLAAITGYLLAAVFNEREQATAEMEYRAGHDVLTGLMNRYEFERRLEVALQDVSRRYALLYLDLDQFKLINDTCGHLAGDDMLRTLSDTLQDSLPRNAVLARLGGDEFGCLVQDSSMDEAQSVARKVHETIRGFKFAVGELSFTVGVSVGATFLSPQQDRGPDDVLGRADIACYMAKEHGRNRTYFYDLADGEMHKRHEEIQEISQIQSALVGGLFELYGQRISNLSEAADTTAFFEVLLHYSDPKGRMSIEDMLGIARRYGLMAQVDRWVFEQSARLLQRSSGRDLKLSVNVSATTLESEGFQQFLLALPGQYGFRAEQMMVEITEAVAVQNLRRAVDNLRALHRHGFGIALDDFGAGVASFGYLSELPVTMVKVDGSFIRDLGKDPVAEVVIGSLARVAALRDISCVAEWVEDAALIPWLRRLGIQYAQGYAIHVPAPFAALEAEWNLAAATI